MCKFTNHLFARTPLIILMLICLNASVQVVTAPPPYLLQRENGRFFLDLQDAADNYNDNDFDLRYDQRQRGSENFRLKLDGFFIGMPLFEQDTQGLMSMTDDLLDNLGEELLWGLGKNGKLTAASATTTAPTATPTTNALTHEQQQQQPLNYKLIANEPDANQLLEQVNVGKPGALLFEIPAAKRAIEGRQHAGEGRIIAEPNRGSRTKLHIYHLLNLLRRSRRD